MRFTPLLLLLFAALGTSAAASERPLPFVAAPVNDHVLAETVGMGAIDWRLRARLSDELSCLSLRQTASIGTVVKDLWLIDVASPLVAANVRAAIDR